MVVSQEVQCALAAGQPVVALESTIITHGMPYPQNLETAQQVEAVVSCSLQGPLRRQCCETAKHSGESMHCSSAAICTCAFLFFMRQQS